MAKTKYPVETKEWAINEVRAGRSAYSVAKELKIRPATVLNWCEKAGVQSQHKRQMVTDDEIIKTIKKFKVAKESEIRNTLGLKGLQMRLRRMVRDGKIKTKTISKAKSKVKHFFAGYINCKLYYIDEEDFNKWMEQKIRNIPKHLRKPLYHFLKGAGIEIPKEQPKAKYVAIPLDVYNAIKHKAKTHHKSVKEYIEEAVLD